MASIAVSRARVLHLFFDTNLLIQCKVLDEIDWSVWEDFDEVQLIATRPVQREIDYQKNKSRGRVNDRARKASSLFREILRSDSRIKVVQDSAPRVAIKIRPDLQPQEDLRGELDYTERDDQLVGTVSTFFQSHPDEEAFETPSETEIQRYNRKLYPEWIDSCEEILRGFHGALALHQGKPALSFRIQNTGSRPARDSLITLSSQGSIYIAPPEKIEEDKQPIRYGLTRLPQPPRPPMGRWRNLLHQFGHPATLADLGSWRSPIPDIAPIDFRAQRDPNAFFYKSGDRGVPTDMFSLDCAQWRHGLDAEEFIG